MLHILWRSSSWLHHQHMIICIFYGFITTFDISDNFFKLQYLRYSLSCVLLLSLHFLFKVLIRSFKAFFSYWWNVKNSYLPVHKCSSTILILSLKSKCNCLYRASKILRRLQCKEIVSCVEIEIDYKNSIFFSFCNNF